MVHLKVLFTTSIRGDFVLKKKPQILTQKKKIIMSCVFFANDLFAVTMTIIAVF